MKSLSPDQLYRRCDPEQFAFATTAELEDLTDIIGQERAVAAVKFGIGIRREGYNLFALGPNGTGRFTAVNQLLQRITGAQAPPPDWCYVYNFQDDYRPQALKLPPGRACQLAADMKRLLEEMQDVIPAAFESDEYHARQQTIEEAFKQEQDAAFEELQSQAQARDVALIRTPSGLAFAPLREKEVISPEQFMELPEAERKQIQHEIEDLQGELQRVLRQAPQWLRESRQKMKTLNEEVASFAATPLFEELREEYEGIEAALAYLTAVQADIIENSGRFLEDEESENPEAARRSFFSRYEVNALVTNNQENGAPVIYEDNPTYPNLIGRVEHIAQMGALVTDFRQIKPGALHRANGGYLILDARKLLTEPYSWEGLKRALQSRQISIESLGQAYNMISVVSLEPQRIPLDVKVVLLGERMLYYMLHQMDPDFSELFKVAADFEDQMDRTPENDQFYARLVATLIRKEDLLHFDKTAVARVIEHSARLVGDAEKLSTGMQSVVDLLREADYWARANGARANNSDLVGVADVQEAIDAQIFRASRLRDRMQEAILRETIMVDSDGEQVGQINGLSVLAVGDFAFGQPSRITARVRLGKGEVVDIERQVEMGGPLHSKGVLILAAFLGARYAKERPLSISASLVFEQSYGGVDGDSASSTELYALLSALSGLPIKQGLAVTGSVNQMGQVQAIGGVNEKIEGFFDICEARGLTGDQGVLIPAANVKHLMLRQDVTEAVADGRFHIYPIAHIDEGIELLTGVTAGELDGDGRYPEGSVNFLVMQQLDRFAEKQRELTRRETKDE
jgi:lon-related putative ATP-dependent protease